MGCSLIRLQGEKRIFRVFLLVTPHHESAIRIGFFATPVQGKERWVRKSEIFCCNSKSHFCIETNGAENGPEAAESFTWELFTRTSLLEQFWNTSFRLDTNFWKVCDHPGGYFICWACVTYHTCKANVQTANTSLMWIDIMITNCQMKCRFSPEIPGWQILAGIETQTCNLPTQIQFQFWRRSSWQGLAIIHSYTRLVPHDINLASVICIRR